MNTPTAPFQTRNEALRALTDPTCTHCRGTGEVPSISLTELFMSRDMVMAACRCVIKHPEWTYCF